MSKSEATPKNEKAGRATLTAQQTGKKTEATMSFATAPIGKMDAAPVLRDVSTVCHNMAVIFPKSLHSALAAIGIKYNGKSADKKVHVQLEVVGNKLVVTAVPPEQKKK